MPTTTRSSSGSVSSRCATAMTSTPRRRAVSAKSTGNRPLPAISPIRSTPLLSTADPAPRGGEKIDQSPHLGYLPQRLAGGLDGRSPRTAPLEQQPIGPLDRADGPGCKASAAEPEQVAAVQTGAIARHRAEGRRVQREPGARPVQRRLP